jgi:hypothetical protein
MKTIKNKLFLATAILALASCADNTYLGDQDINTPGNGGAIQFSSIAPNITRAAGTATDAKNLGYSFAVYATKTVSSTTSNVFAHNAIGTPDANNNHTPYWVWYNTDTHNTTASNTSNWEYVGAAGTKTIPESGTFTLPTTQEIKYWDYSASQYDFVAYKATVETGSGADLRPKITHYTTSGFTVQATPAQLAGLYVADKITVTSANSSPTTPGSLPSTTETKIGDIVQFTFRAAGAKVRLGIYETIPGYEVQNVKFRPNTSEFNATTTNATLTGSFNGTSSSTEGTYTVTYNGTTGVAEFDNSGSASTYFDFGAFTSSSAIGTSSITPTWAGNATSPYYQSVLPNTDNVGNMILYVDYELHNSTSGEIIHVYGAKAVVPEMYMKWNPNYAYTYLFKISDNTNGQTKPGTGTPVGLFPITFDAVTIATTDGQNVGTITTVSSPTITTYQEGSVSPAGITYAEATQPIYITINNEGTLQELTSVNTKLYTVNAGTTEADLLLGVTTTGKTEVTSGTNALNIPTSGENETVQGITFTVNKYAKFSPADNQTYAIAYQTSSAVPESYSDPIDVTVGTTDVTGLFERTGDVGNYTYTLTTDTTAENNKSYCRYNPAIPAGWQYKIIIVGNPT